MTRYAALRDRVRSWAADADWLITSAEGRSDLTEMTARLASDMQPLREMYVVLDRLARADPDQVRALIGDPFEAADRRRR